MLFEGPVELTFASKRAFELIDVTDDITARVATWAITSGVVHIYCPHTSCGLLVTEMEDGLHEDLEALAARIAPLDAEYAHDDMARRYQNLEPDERRNGWSHLRAATMTQPSMTVPIADGAVGLGKWQRLFLLELDGPRPTRRLSVQAWGRATGRAQDLQETHTRHD